VIKQLFKENRLAKGEFVALGRKLNLRDITCPAYLLAGASDVSTTPNKSSMLQISRHAEGPNCAEDGACGHIGLFMGARTLKEHWPSIAQWITDQ